jgi:hypothetical protein
MDITEVGYPFDCHPRVRSRCAVAWSALSGFVCRAEGVVPRRRGVHGLPGLAALAGGAGVSGVRACGDGRDDGACVALRWVSQEGLAYRRDDLSGHAHAADGVVRRGLVHDRRSGRRVGVDDAEATGAGFLPDRVDDAAPLPDRDGAARSGGPHRAGGGRRDLPRRGAPWGAWARRAGQDAGGDRGRAARAAWLRSGPDEHHPERGGQDPAQVPDRPRWSPDLPC